MIQKSGIYEDEKVVPFTVSGLNISRSNCEGIITSGEWEPSYQGQGVGLYVHSQVIQPGDSKPLHICMSNTGDLGLTLEFGIAYACVFGPDLTSTPKIVVVDNAKQLYPKTTNKIVYYNINNAIKFKQMVKKKEKQELIQQGIKLFNGDPKW